MDQTAGLRTPVVLITMGIDPLSAFLPAFTVAVIIAILLRIFSHYHPDVKLYGMFRTYLRKLWFPGLVALLGFSGTAYLGGLSVASSVDLEVDMQISDGRIAGAYVNELFSQPHWLTIDPNSRRIYRFEQLPATLTYLRIDPSDALGARISIYGITVASEGRIVRTFTPGELTSWTLYNLTSTPGDPAAFNVITTQKGASFLATNVSLVASHRPAWLRYILGVLQRPDFYSLLCISYFLLFLLCGLSTIHGAVDAGLVAALALVAYPLAVLVGKMPVSATSVASAVGLANYVGYPKFRDYLTSFALLILCISVAWATSRYLPLPAPPLATPEDKTASISVRARLSGFAPIAVFVFVLTLYLPDLSGLLQQLNQASFHAADWDRQNFLWWSYLVHQGYVPLRSFWYPYSGFYVHLLPLPAGKLIECMEEVLTLWFLYFGLRFSVPRGRKAAFLLFVTILLPVWINEFSGWYRYLLAADLSLFYVAIQQTQYLDWRRHTPFALLAGFVFFYEPTQLLYAASGMLGHSLLLLWKRIKGTPSLKATCVQMLPLLRQRLWCIAVPMLAGILPVFAFFAAMGMLPGFVRFQLSLSDLSIYGSLPADIPGWIFPTLRFETMFMVLFFTLTLVLYGWFRDRGPHDLPTVAAVVMGFTGFMALQKHVTRAPVLQQVQIYPYICVLLYGMVAWPRRTKAQCAVVALFVGSIAGIAGSRGALGTLFRTIATMPTVVAHDYDLLLHRGREVKVANASRYDRARFASFTSQNAVVDVLKGEFGWDRQQRVYVLGDDPAFYILLGGDFPYVATNYNCSPITEQERVLQWLRERPPRFVLWNPSNDTFDRVPHLVRLPLIYQFVVENYSVVRTVAPYDILMNLRERPATDPFYWVRRLGTRLDVGSIPALAKASDYRVCPTRSSPPCQQVLFVHLPEGAPAGKGLIVINSPSGQFQVTFDMVAGTSEYLVDLDRLWFRSFIGAVPHATFSVANAELASEFRFRKNGVLY